MTVDAPEAPVDAATRDDATVDPVPAPRGRVRQLLPWLLAVLALAAAVTTTVAWRAAADRSSTRADVESVAGRFMDGFVNWDASDGLDEVFAVMAELGTDRLADEAASEELPGLLLDQLEAADARSQGDVLEVVAGDAAGTEATAVAQVRQTLSSTELPAPVTTCLSAHMVLVSLDGAWRVDQLDLYGPGPCPTEED